MSELLLTSAEVRVLAALVEKSVATPQYYPMTVNALMAASNQKTARHPVMNLSEGEVGAALNSLEALGLAARDDLAGRVPKWRHRFQHQLLLKPPALALLATLMLRGPQTLSELKANAAGIGGPADAQDVSAALADLADRAQPLVMLLPRAAGQSAARYAHLLCGAPVVSETPEAAPVPRPSTDTLAALEARIQALELRVAELEAACGGPPLPV
jgi:uncharacterized protein YceH (UPF0502 family)